MLTLRMAVMAVVLAFLAAGCNGSSSNTQQSSVQQVNLLPSDGDGGSLDNSQPKSLKILFVGDSFTYGRRDPAKSYNWQNVTDLTQQFTYTGTSAARSPDADEAHPWGGVPGIFQKMASLAKDSNLIANGGGALPAYQVSISAWPATTLKEHFSDTSVSDNINKTSLSTNLTNEKWDIVVLQEQSDEPLISNSIFSKYAGSIIEKIKGNNNNSIFYLYKTWAKPIDLDTQWKNYDSYLSELSKSNIINSNDAVSLYAITKLLNINFDSVADANKIYGIPVGDAFLSAYNKYMATQGFNITDKSNFVPKVVPKDANQQCVSFPLNLWFDDREHASPHGSYLAALVIFSRITGVSPLKLDGLDAEIYQAMCLNDADAKSLKTIANSTVFPSTTLSNGN